MDPDDSGYGGVFGKAGWFIRHRPVMSEGIRNPAALIGIPVKYLVRRKPEWVLAWLAQDWWNHLPGSTPQIFDHRLLIGSGMRDEDRALAALQNFIAELNEAWEAAGPPSYSRLEKLSEQFGASEQARGLGLRVRVLAASTTHDILTGKRRSLPEWAWVVSFVNVLRIAAVENALDPDVVGAVAEWKIRHQTARATMREAQSDPDPPGMRVHRIHPGKGRRKRKPPKPPERPPRLALTNRQPLRVA